MPSSPLVRAGALALLAGALACGKSPQERLYEQRRDTCLGFAANGLTLREAEEALSGPVSRALCRPGEDSGEPGELFQRFPGDECDHTRLLCNLGWCYIDNDPDLCGDFGCWYSCGVRVVFKDDDGDGFLDDDTVICGARWASGQPTPSFCNVF